MRYSIGLILSEEFCKLLLVKYMSDIPNTKSTPSFMIDSILHGNSENESGVKEVYPIAVPKYSVPLNKINNHRLHYSYSHCESRQTLYPALDRPSRSNFEMTPYYKSKFESYHSPTVFSYYSSYNQRSRYPAIPNASSSKPLLSHSTSVVNLDVHRNSHKSVHQSPTPNVDKETNSNGNLLFYYF